MHDEHFLPEHSTITLGMVRSYPEEIKLSGVCRLVPAKGRNVYEAWLERLRQDCAATGATFHILDYKPPFSTDAEGPFFDILKSVSSNIGLSEKRIAAPACTEANIFQRLGIESAVFGPGDFTGTIHASQEHVPARDLDRATEFYKKLIESYCR